MKSNQHLYEGMFILRPNLSDETRLQLLDKIRAGITSAAGKIEKEHDMGRRKLAYKIEKHSEGYYVLIYFTLPTQSMKEYWHQLSLMNEAGLLRFMTVTVDEVKEELRFAELATT